jgi:hypothetical protein
MQGVEESHLNAVISVMLNAAFSFWESTIEQLLRPLATTYGKKDTLAMDAMPEITIVNGLKEYDKFSVVVTEESNSEFNNLNDPRLFRTVFVSDPTDRSSMIKKVFSSVKEEDRKRKAFELISEPGFKEIWEKDCSNPIGITGGCCAVTCVRRGIPIFSVIINYMTKQLFLACDAGCYCFIISNEKKELKVSDILSSGNKFFFNGCDDTNLMHFTTYQGKDIYMNNFIDSKFMDKDEIEKNLLYGVPGGPSRVLYLSTLQKEDMGFVMANGEKITAWIHWLPYVRFARRDSNQSVPALQLFEVYQDRPWTKDGILMSTPPAYSIFKLVENTKKMIIDVGRFPAYFNPSKIRSTLILCPFNNQWATRIVNQYGYRPIYLYEE